MIKNIHHIVTTGYSTEKEAWYLMIVDLEGKQVELKMHRNIDEVSAHHEKVMLGLWQLMHDYQEK